MLPFEEVLRGERKKTKRKLKVQLDDIEEKQNLDNGSEEKSKGWDKENDDHLKRIEWKSKAYLDDDVSRYFDALHFKIDPESVN